MPRTHRIRTTKAQLDAALARAKTFYSIDRRVRQAWYEEATDRVCLLMADGIQICIPRGFLQGLKDAKPSQLAQIEVVGNGTGLHWPQLDADHYVLGLLDGVFGTKRWMAQLGQIGGASRSAAKVAAARRNGGKGGRPVTKNAESAPAVRSAGRRKAKTA